MTARPLTPDEVRRVTRCECWHYWGEHGPDGCIALMGATTFCRCTRDDETLAQVAALVAEREAALADRLDARAARYRAAAGSAGSRADRLGLGRPFWSRAVGMESYYMKRAEHFRIAAAVIRETRGKP